MSTTTVAPPTDSTGPPAEAEVEARRAAMFAAVAVAVAAGAPAPWAINMSDGARGFYLWLPDDRPDLAAFWAGQLGFAHPRLADHVGTRESGPFRAYRAVAGHGVFHGAVSAQVSTFITFSDPYLVPACEVRPYDQVAVDPWGGILHALDRMTGAEWRTVLPPRAQVFDPGTGPMPGYVAGSCGHRVAGSEWNAGLYVCERCSAAEYPVPLLVEGGVGPGPFRLDPGTEVVVRTARVDGEVG